MRPPRTAPLLSVRPIEGPRPAAAGIKISITGRERQVDDVEPPSIAPDAVLAHHRAPFAEQEPRTPAHFFIASDRNKFKIPPLTHAGRGRRVARAVLA